MSNLRQNSSKLAALSVYFLDNFALAIVYPIFTPLLFGHHSALLNSVTSARFAYLGILIAAFPLMQLFGSPIIGGLSDRMGRKKAFYLTLIGEAIGFAMSALAIKQNSYSFLLFSRLWTGFFAGNLTVCLAVFADMNEAIKNRSKGFGYLMMAGGLSFIIAVIVGGLLSNSHVLSTFNPATPFWVTTFLTIINLGIILGCFTETAQPSHASPIKNLCRICISEEYKGVRKLYAIYFFFMLAWIPTLQFLSPLLFIDYHAKPLEITALFVVVGIVWSLSSGLINQLLNTHHKPQKILRLGLLVLIACFIATIFPYRLWSIAIILCVLTSAAALCWISNLSLISIDGCKTLQGKILGLNQSFGSLAMILGPIMGSYFGTMNIHYIYLTSAISVFISFIIFVKK
ncbi:MAG: MFS transporter [Chlamydiales bacterium]|nr:MFS transporter [Chlamydiales bacterium]